MMKGPPFFYVVTPGAVRGPDGAEHLAFCQQLDFLVERTMILRQVLLFGFLQNEVKN
jgi:hypothetical protein